MEHSFPINMGGSTYNWKLYDVGGAVRSPFFTEAPETAMPSDISIIPSYQRGQVGAAQHSICNGYLMISPRFSSSDMHGFRISMMVIIIIPSILPA